MDDQERAPERPLDGIDFSALSRGERYVMLSGGLLFLSGFLPWWFRVRTPATTFWHGASLTGLSLSAVLLGAVAAIAVLVRAWRFPQRGPADGLAYAGMGALSATLLVVEIVRDTPTSTGVYVGLTFALTLVAAGIKRRAERKAGWI